MKALALVGLAACGTSAPAAVCGGAHWYAVTHVTLPQMPGDGLRYGLDLDGDRNVDNAFGSILATIRSIETTDEDFDGPVAAHLAAAGPIWRVGIASCDDGTSRVTISQGQAAGPTPFVADTLANGDLAGSDGEADVPITIVADLLGTFTPIAWDRVRAVAVDLRVDATAIDGVIGFGLPMPADQRELAAPFAPYITHEMAIGNWSYDMDANGDGVVTVDELLADGGVQTLLPPDLDGGKGLSFGLGVHGTPIAAP